MRKEHSYFNYAGVDSLNYNIINVSINESIYKENFIANRKIKEVTTSERDEPYFQKIEKQPLQFSLQLFFEEKWNEELIREVARWLHQETYKPLYFSGEPDRIYYAMPIENIEIIHNGLQQGYLELTMRCNTYHAYTREYISDVYDCSENNDVIEIELTNEGDLPINPDIWIKKIGEGEVKITNTTNSGEITKFESGKKAQGNLKFTGSVFDGETVTIGDTVLEFDTGDGFVNSDVAEWVSGNLYLEETVVNKNGILFRCIKRNSDETWDEIKWLKLDKQNVKVDISANCLPSQTNLKFNENNILDGDTITIGTNTYEFDVNDVYNAKNGNIPIPIKDYCKSATGKLVAKSNESFTNAKITIGEKTYTILPTSGEINVMMLKSNIISYNNFLIDYTGIDKSSMTSPVLLMNEKRDNSLNGLRIPFVNNEINKNIQDNKQITSLYKLTKMLNIPRAGYGDMGKYEPIASGITGQTIGDELTVFKRECADVTIDKSQSTKNKFYITKSHDGYVRYYITNEQLIAKAGDIILFAKEPYTTSYVDYKGNQYPKADFEFLRVKNCGESNPTLNSTEKDTNSIWYEFETPSTLFEENPLLSYGRGHNVYGTGIDLEKAKTYLREFGYGFIDSAKIPEIELKTMIVAGDLIVGGTGAKGGVSFEVADVERLGGQNRFETEQAIITKTRTIRNSSPDFLDWSFCKVIIFHKQSKKIIIEPPVQFSEPYQIRQGLTIDETCENIVKAVQDTGTDWTEYSKGTFENEDIDIEYDKLTKTITIKAKKIGEDGNNIVTIINDWDTSQKLIAKGEIINQFESNTLLGGSNPKWNSVTNEKMLINYLTDILKEKEDKMNITCTDNIINIKSKIWGSLDNIIPVINECNACGFYNINNQPCVTLEDGKDANIGDVLLALNTVLIGLNSELNINSTIDSVNNSINIEYNITGKQGNIPVSTTAINTFWDCSSKLYGGQDGLENNEEIWVFGENAHIESNLRKPRYDTFNNNYLTLVRGVNRLLIKGKCFIQFKKQCKLL